MTKAQPVEIKITGVHQVATVRSLYQAKKEADTAAEFFGRCRESFLTMMVPKIYKHWVSVRAVVTGKFVMVLSDDVKATEEVTVQNRQNTKSYTAKESIEVLERLNAQIPEDKALRASDVFSVATDRIINPVAMNVPAVKSRVLAALVTLEHELKESGAMPPEMGLVLEVKTVGLKDTVIPRLLSVSSDFEGSMKVLGDPVTVSVVNKRKTPNDPQ
jgi:hypothetical protein